MRRISMFSGLVMLLVCCLHTSQVTWEIRDRQAMKSAILQGVPLGTSVQQAQRFMEGEGYTCSVTRNGTFYERLAFCDAGLKHAGIDFLNCRRLQGDGALFMSRFWEVALVLDRDTVVDVLVANWIDGP